MADDAAVASPKKAKKLPFKPTALRKAGTPKAASSDKQHTDRGGVDDDDDGLALFRRSKEMEPIVAADHERRLRRRQRLDEERRRSLSTPLGKRPLDHSAADDQSHSPSRESIRSQDLPDRDVFAAGASMTTCRNSSSELVTSPASKRSRSDSTPSKQRRPILGIGDDDWVAVESPSRILRSASKLATPTKTPQAVASPSKGSLVISLDSDDDSDLVATPTPCKRRNKPPAEEVDNEPPAVPANDDDDGDEFGEYVRRAEEQRARDRAMLDRGGTPVKETVDVWITSTVPKTAPCRAKFVFDKPLRVVRNTWATLQRGNGAELLPPQDDDIILTWRRNRVYASSTLLSLGIRPQGNGRIVVDGDRDYHGARKDGGGSGLVRNRAGVVLEAWTPELFQQMQREEELRRRRDAGELSDSDDGDRAAPEGMAPDEAAPEVKLRVILRARGMDDVKLTVRPETTVETLVTGFRAQRGIGSDRDVGLWFDGDRLAEHVTMEEAEIDEMDTFEVHIK